MRNADNNGYCASVLRWQRYLLCVAQTFCYYFPMHQRADQIGKGQYSISVEYLAAFLEFVTESGVDASAILLDADFAPESIVKQSQFVGHVTFNLAIKSLLNQRPDPHHAYRFARRPSELRHGTAGVVAQNSQTLREAMELGIRYLRPQLGNTHRLLLRTENDTITTTKSTVSPRL